MPDGRPLAELGDLDMRIARDGTWHYRGSPINRIPLVKLFASVLRRENDGSYWLVTPAERGRVTVEDAPFLAVALDLQDQGRGQRLIFRTNLDEIVTAGPDHPLRVETAADGAPGASGKGGRGWATERPDVRTHAERGHEDVGSQHPPSANGRSARAWACAGHPGRAAGSSEACPRRRRRHARLRRGSTRAVRRACGRGG